MTTRIKIVEKNSGKLTYIVQYRKDFLTDKQSEQVICILLFLSVVFCWVPFIHYGLYSNHEVAEYETMKEAQDICDNVHAEIAAAQKEKWDSKVKKITYLKYP